MVRGVRECGGREGARLGRVVMVVGVSGMVLIRTRKQMMAMEARSAAAHLCCADLHQSTLDRDSKLYCSAASPR